MAFTFPELGGLGCSKIGSSSIVCLSCRSACYMRDLSRRSRISITCRISLLTQRYIYISGKASFVNSTVKPTRNQRPPFATCPGKRSIERILYTRPAARFELYPVQYGKDCDTQAFLNQSQISIWDFPRSFGLLDVSGMVSVITRTG